LFVCLLGLVPSVRLCRVANFPHWGCLCSRVSGGGQVLRFSVFLSVLGVPELCSILRGCSGAFWGPADACPKLWCGTCAFRRAGPMSPASLWLCPVCNRGVTKSWFHCPLVVPALMGCDPRDSSQVSVVQAVCVLCSGVSLGAESRSLGPSSFGVSPGFEWGWT